MHPRNLILARARHAKNPRCINARVRVNVVRGSGDCGDDKIGETVELVRIAEHPAAASTTTLLLSQPQLRCIEFGHGQSGQGSDENVVARSKKIYIAKMVRPEALINLGSFLLRYSCIVSVFSCHRFSVAIEFSISIDRTSRNLDISKRRKHQ